MLDRFRLKKDQPGNAAFKQLCPAAQLNRYGPCKFRRGKMVYLGALSRPKIFEAAWRAGPRARFPVHVVPLRGEELHVSQDALRDVEDFVRLSILQRFCSNFQASQGRRYLLAGRTSTARPEQRK